MALWLVIEYKTEIASTKFQNPSMSHKMDERPSAATFLLLSKSVEEKTEILYFLKYLLAFDVTKNVNWSNKIVSLSA